MNTKKENILTCQNCGSTNWHRSFTAESTFKSVSGDTVAYVGDTEGQYDGALTCSVCNEEYQKEEQILERYD